MLAKWLEAVCLEQAQRFPDDLHCAHLGLGRLWFRVFSGCRLRAAIFVNLATMRRCMTSSSNGLLTLSRTNLEGLQKSCFLFHAAHSCAMIASESRLRRFFVDLRSGGRGAAEL